MQCTDSKISVRHQAMVRLAKRSQSTMTTINYKHGRKLSNACYTKFHNLFQQVFTYVLICCARYVSASAHTCYVYVQVRTKYNFPSNFHHWLYTQRWIYESPTQNTHSAVTKWRGNQSSYRAFHYFHSYVAISPRNPVKLNSFKAINA